MFAAAVPFMVLLLLLLLAAGTGMGLVPAEDGPPVWPAPRRYVDAHGKAACDLGDVGKARVAFGKATQAEDRFLRAAWARFLDDVGADDEGEMSAGETTTEVSIDVADTSMPDAWPAGVDEAYSLAVCKQGTPAVEIHANTLVGAVRALTTLAQITHRRADFGQPGARFVVENTPVQVEDAPRFQHRGLLMDTARHFQSVKSILALVDAMAYVKANVLHWHIVDSQSFPYASMRRPQLASNGAYSKGEVYTPSDVRRVRRAAFARGVRVVMEVDTPGHAESWCDGEPSICPNSTCRTPLRPDKNATFDVVRDVLLDLAVDAPDAYFHLGGDEVVEKCWTEVPEVAAWLDARGWLATPDKAYEYFVARVHEIATTPPLSRVAVVWEEVWNHFGDALDRDSVIVHAWLEHSKALANATSQGYRALFSDSSVWYLDHLKVSWQTMYDAEPCANVDGGPDGEICASYVLGGEACMWGETVDGGDLLSTVFPRFAAVAERLWSPHGGPSAAYQGERMARLRCALLKKGVGSGARLCEADGQCGRATPRSAEYYSGSCWDV